VVLAQVGDEVRPDVLVELPTTRTTAAAATTTTTTSLGWSGSTLAATTV
jgi:hypothetical protein